MTWRCPSVALSREGSLPCGVMEYALLIRIQACTFRERSLSIASGVKINQKDNPLPPTPGVKLDVEY